jgi:hypothetical protein
MRNIDGTGHHPDKVQPGEANPKQDDGKVLSKVLCPYDDPALRCAWMEGYLAAVAIVVARGQAQLEEITRRAA